MTCIDGSLFLNAMIRQRGPNSICRKRSVALMVFYLSLLLALWFTLAGCQGTAKIARTTTEVRGLAESSLKRFDLIAAQSPAVSKEAAKGASEQSRIIDLTGDIQDTLPYVEDKVPEWIRLSMVAGVAAVGLIIIVLIWQTGIAPVLRALFSRIAFMIPKAKREEANLLQGALNGDEKKIREAIAAKRASDPSFDAAWKAEKTRKSKADSTNI